MFRVDLDQPIQRLGAAGQRVGRRHRLVQRGDAPVHRTGRSADTTGITQRDDRFADGHRVGVTDIGGLQAAPGKLQYRDVMVAVEADHRGREGLAIADGPRGQVGSAGDHVVVGENTRWDRSQCRFPRPPRSDSRAWRRCRRSCGPTCPTADSASCGAGGVNGDACAGAVARPSPTTAIRLSNAQRPPRSSGGAIRSSRYLLHRFQPELSRECRSVGGPTARHLFTSP